MRTVDDARKECVAKLRHLADECEKQSWQQRFSELQAKRDAYLYAAEIVQTCFAGLAPEGFPPGRDPSARATLERITPIVDPQVHAALEDVEYYSTGEPDFLDELVAESTALDPAFPAKLAAARKRRAAEREEAQS